MAKLPEGDPFDEVDGTPLSVTPGAFEGGTGEDTGVAGWDSSPKPAPNRRGLYVALSLFVLMALIVPIGVGFFANIRREYIAEQAAAGASPAIVELSQDVQAVQERLDPIQAAHTMSSGIAEESINAEMTSLVETATASVLSNDAGKAQSSADSAESYFVETYSQSLPDRATMILENYPFSEPETDARIDELFSIIRGNAQGQDLSALTAAVIELPQRIGDAMTEHLGNRVTYVPPSDSGKPEPTPTQPPGTVAPGQTGSPGDTAAFGNANANANANGDNDKGQDGDTDTDPTWTSGPGSAGANPNGDENAGGGNDSSSGGNPGGSSDSGSDAGDDDDGSSPGTGSGT